MLIAGFSAGVEVAVVFLHIPSIAAAEVGVACRGVADAPKLRGGRGSAKNPEGLIGFILALVNIDVQLRLALFYRNERKQSGGDFAASLPKRCRRGGNSGLVKRQDAPCFQKTELGFHID